MNAGELPIGAVLYDEGGADVLQTRARKAME
jgi:hypothetical protein